MADTQSRSCWESGRSCERPYYRYQSLVRAVNLMGMLDMLIPQDVIEQAKIAFAKHETKRRERVRAVLNENFASIPDLNLVADELYKVSSQISCLRGVADSIDNKMLKQVLGAIANQLEEAAGAQDDD